MLKVVRGTLLHVSFASDHSVLMKGNKGDVKGGSTDSGGAPADKREASIRSEESVYTDSNRPPSDKDPRNSERNTGEDCARGNGRNKDMPRGGNNDSGDDSGDDDDGVSDIDRDYLMRDLISISRQTARSRTVLRRASLAMSHHTDLEDREGIRSKDCGAQSHSKSDLDGATFKKQKLLIVKAEEALVSCAVEREEHRGTEREKQEKGKEGKRAAMQMEMEVEAQDYPVRVVYKEARFVIGQKRSVSFCRGLSERADRV